MSASPPPERLVIGITGYIGSGRRTVAEYMEDSLKAQLINLAQDLREVASEKGNNKPSREELQDLGDKLRETIGLHVLAERAMGKANKEFVIIKGIKNIGEVSYLRRTVPGFLLMGVDASEPTRFRRLRDKHDYPGDEDTAHQTFHRDDLRDRKDVEAFTGELKPNVQQVDICMAEADLIIWNDSCLITGGESEPPLPMETLELKIKSFLEPLVKPGSRRPGKSEVFMAQAVAASLQSRCTQRRVGAVLCNSENHVVASGYNNVPSRQFPCIAQLGGCQRENLKANLFRSVGGALKCRCGHEQLTADLRCPKCKTDHALIFADFKNLDFCRSIHAEEAAILQAARFGGPGISGGVLYTTTFPCNLCAKKIAEAGIRRVVFLEDYPVEVAKAVLAENGVKAERFEGYTYRAFHKIYGTL